MQYQLKTADSKMKQPANRIAVITKKQKTSLALNSYVKVDAQSEWKNFLSLIKK